MEMFALERTYANVVDLCGRIIVDELGLLIDPIRELLRLFRSLPDKNEKFRTLCQETGLDPRLFGFNFSEDWRKTLNNLDITYKYREVLTKLCDACANHCPLDDSQWDAINGMIKLLSKFHDVVGTCSLVYDVSCPLVIQDCIAIVRTLIIYERYPRFCSVVRNVRSKWLELFPEIPTIYCVASILDPRLKVEGLKQLLAYYHEALGVTYDDNKVANCKSVLQQLYDHCAPPREAETKMASSAGEADNKSCSSLEFNVIRDVLKRKRGDADQEKNCHLAYYLFYKVDIQEEEFDVLEWWEEKQEILPVLSKVAKDVLCTPLSTNFLKGGTLSREKNS